MSFTNIVRTAGNIQGSIGAVGNFVQSILSYFGSDIVGVFDNDTQQQLFTDARPVKANLTRTVKLMDHPIENGSIITDFAINMPLEVELSVIINSDNFAQTYQQLVQYQKAARLVAIQLKVGFHDNMIIQSLGEDESADVFDAAVVAIKLREVQLVTVQYQALTTAQVQQPADTSTVNAGTQQPQQESALYQIGNFVGGIFK